MNIDVVTSTIIARPVDAVAIFAANPDNAPAWYVNIKQVRWRTERPARVGSQIEFVAHFLGRTLAYTYEITELEPGKLLVMRTAEGPFPMQTSYEWREDAGGKTEMLLRNCGSPTGFSVLLSPLIRWAMRRANRKDLARLKAILEQDPGR